LDFPFGITPNNWFLFIRQLIVFLLLSSKDLFLESLKSQYDKEFERKTTLEGKGSNLLTIAGVVSTLIFGFGIFLIDSLDTSYEPLPILILLLILSIVTNIISILFSVLSFRVQGYRYLMPSDSFYNEDGAFNEEAIEEYSEEQDVGILKDTLIEAHLRCNKHNELANDNKVILIQIAQWFFFAGISTIPFIVGILLLNFPDTG